MTPQQLVLFGESVAAAITAELEVPSYSAACGALGYGDTDHERVRWVQRAGVETIVSALLC